MTKVQYFEKAKFIWLNYVPESGQSKYVQGELLRAIEKLRDEAQRNGNVNWDQGHIILVNYLKSKLLNSGSFNTEISKEIENDLNRLLDYNLPYVEDDIYDRICDRVVDFFVTYPEPIIHDYNVKLKR